MGPLDEQPTAEGTNTTVSNNLLHDESVRGMTTLKARRRRAVVRWLCLFVTAITTSLVYRGIYTSPATA